MIDQNSIRQQINNFCLNHVFNGGTNEITMEQIPFVILVYLGSESCGKLAPYMKNAFSSILKVEPHVQYICLTQDSIGDAEGFSQQIRDVFRRFAAEGALIENQMVNLQISYVALMDDPILTERDLSPALAAIRRETERLQDTNIARFNTSAFFGIFYQEKPGDSFDYRNAFRNVRAGSRFGAGVWPRIFHLQKTILQSSFEGCARAISVCLLNDVMFPDTNASILNEEDTGTYSWNYLGLDELKIPEQIICNILINAYRSQVSGEELGPNEREEFRRNLEKTFFEEIESKCDIFTYPEFVKYLPRNPEYANPGAPARNKGFFGRLLGRDRPEQAEQWDYSGCLADQNEIDTVLTEYAKDLVKELESPEIIRAVCRRALGKGAHVDAAVLRMRDVIMKETGTLLSEMQGQIGRIMLTGVGNTEEEYFRTLFEKYARKEKYETIQEVLEAFLGDKEREEAFGRTIIDILNEIVSDCSSMVNILNNIRISVYGGSNSVQFTETAADFRVGIDVPVEQACMRIPREILKTLVEDERMLKENAEEFITQVQNNSVNRNAKIAQIVGPYRSDSQISYTLLLNRPLENNNMKINNSRLFRENTMMIVSSCRWDSAENLVFYYQRGEE